MKITLRRNSIRTIITYLYEVEPYFIEPYTKKSLGREHKFTRRHEGWSTGVFMSPRY